MTKNKILIHCWALLVMAFTFKSDSFDFQY